MSGRGIDREVARDRAVANDLRRDSRTALPMTELLSIVARLLRLASNSRVAKKTSSTTRRLRAYRVRDGRGSDAPLVEIRRDGTMREPLRTLARPHRTEPDHEV